MASNEEEPPNPTRIFRQARRRTSSFSSSTTSSRASSFGSSSFSYNEEFPPFSPMNPPLKFKGVPFSWEQIPGIPRHQLSTYKKNSSDHLLPLPPAGTITAAAKKLIHQEEISPKKSNRFQNDPFFAALVECSKADDGGGDDHGENYGNNLKGSWKITRNLSEGFGLINMYTACKRTCAVSKSIVYIPRQQRSHYFIDRRSVE